MQLTESQYKELADKIGEFVLGAKSVEVIPYRCSHDPGRKFDLVRATALPRPKLTTATTLGLAHESWEKSNFPDRIELVQAWNDPQFRGERLLALVAESILIRGRLPKPGVIYENAASAAGLTEFAATFPHVLILFPYIWEKTFRKAILDGTRVWWLQVAPIFDEEMRFIEEKGFPAFEDLLLKHGAYFENLNRRPQLTP